MEDLEGRYLLSSGLVHREAARIAAHLRTHHAGHARSHVSSGSANHGAHAFVASVGHHTRTSAISARPIRAQSSGPPTLSPIASTPAIEHQSFPNALVPPYLSVSFDPSTPITTNNGPDFVPDSVGSALLAPSAVQLAYQTQTGAPWTLLNIHVALNPTDNAVVVTPESVQVNGNFVLAIYPPTNGAYQFPFQGPYYLFYSVNDSTYTTSNTSAPYPVTVFAPDGTVPLAHDSHGNVITASNGNPEADPAYNPTATVPTNDFTPQLLGNPGSGVLVADQYEPLDPSTVNSTTIQLDTVDSNGNATLWPHYIVNYDAETPTIELSLTQAEAPGRYRFIETTGVRTLGGFQLSQQVQIDYLVTQQEQPYVVPGDNGGIYIINTSPETLRLNPGVYARTWVSAIGQITFDQPADPSTITSSNLKLQTESALGANDWTDVPAVAVNYNPGLNEVYLVPTVAGTTSAITAPGTFANGVPRSQFPAGIYRFAVDENTTGVKITDLHGNTVAPWYSNPYFYDNQSAYYTNSVAKAWYDSQGPSSVPPNPPVDYVDAIHFGSSPANTMTVTGEPTALVVNFHKWAGDNPSSVNASSIKLYQLADNGSGNTVGDPIPIDIAYNPWPGNAVLVPQRPLARGTAYEIQVSTTPGIVDNAGNKQQLNYNSYLIVQ